MTIPLSLRRHFQQTVTHEACTGEDGTGARTYAAGVPRKCRIEHQLVPMGRDRNGQEVVSRTQVYFDREVAVDLRDRITLPFAPNQPPLIDVRRQWAGQGGTLTHTAVLL